MEGKQFQVYLIKMKTKSIFILGSKLHARLHILLVALHHRKVMPPFAVYNIMKTAER